MARRTPVRIACPVLGQGHAEVEHGMVAARDVPHNDDLAGIDLAPVATPLALHPDRMRAPLGEAVVIKADDAIGVPPLLDHVPNQYAYQRALIPGGGPMNACRTKRSTSTSVAMASTYLRGTWDQQPLEGEGHIALAGVGLQSTLSGCNELAQTVHHVREDVGETRPSRRSASCRCAQAGGIVSPPYIAMPVWDAGGGDGYNTR
jgi:hypothetical protein